MKSNPVINTRGSALVISLSFLAIITILVVSFAASMRTERAASHSMANDAKAKQVVQSALTHAISLLAKNIPDPGDPTVETPVGAARNWFTNPGRLTVIDQSGMTYIPLHTGEATAADPRTAVNLNAQSVATGKYPITGAADPMWISWVNVLEDPTREAADDNKIVSRYAFWIDDESTKINFNVARGKPVDVLPGPSGLPSGWATDKEGRDLMSYITPLFEIGTKHSLSDPASINLDTLGVNVIALGDEVSQRGFFEAPEDIKKFTTGDPDSFFESHKFNLTPFSRSPEFNVFGKSRMFMQGGVGDSSKTPMWDLSKGPTYQHFGSLEQPMLFYGGYSGVEKKSGDIDTAMARELRVPSASAIAKYLDRNDWPGFSNKRFRWSAATKGKEECDQIAINMAEMGFWGTTSTNTGNTGLKDRSKMQTDALTTYGGSSGAFPGATSPNVFLWKGALSGKPILPDYLGPRMTELACTVYPVSVSGGYTIRWNFSPEFYLPPGGYWYSEPNTTEKTFVNDGTGNYMLSYMPTFCTITAADATRTFTNTFNVASFTAAGFTSQKKDLPKDIPLDRYTFTVGNNYYLRKTSGTPLLAVSKENSATLSLPITITVKVRYALVSRNGSKPIQLAPGTVPQGEGGDPALFASPDGDSTLEYTMTVNSADAEGVTQSLGIGDPRLSLHKSEWRVHSDSADPDSVDSLGAANPDLYEFDDSAASKWAMWMWKENGYRANSIGMFSFVPTGIQRAIPGETMRFHSYTLGPDEVPDWAILDLVAPRYPYPISYMNSTAGRINLNSKIFPDASAVFSPPKRTEPLRALLAHMPNADEVVKNIGKYQDDGGYFDYIGKICEVPKVADHDTGPTDFEKEVIVRNLASLMTTQSNTFGVWGVAQTVKKKPGNKAHAAFETGDLVTGEKRFYAVVERYVWPGKDGVPGNAKADSSGRYAASNNSFPESPGSAPTKESWSGAKTVPIWAATDGPQGIGATPGFMGTFPYNASPLQSADNPLAAAMKYRVIYFTYLD